MPKQSTHTKPSELSKSSRFLSSSKIRRAAYDADSEIEDPFSSSEDSSPAKKRQNRMHPAKSNLRGKSRETN